MVTTTGLRASQGRHTWAGLRILLDDVWCVSRSKGTWENGKKYKISKAAFRLSQDNAARLSRIPAGHDELLSSMCGSPCK
eukprot:360771-Chlamydomonas_euryale.AAC.1